MNTSMEKKKPPTVGSIPTPKMRRGLSGMVRETIREMHHVSWPTLHETNRLTGVVLIICTMVVGVLYVLSIVASILFETLGIAG